MPFQKGKSGNPGGRPKVIGEVQTLARQYTKEAIETILQIMRDQKTHSSAPVTAAVALLDRGFGKPHQTSESTVTHQRSELDGMTEQQLREFILAELEPAPPLLAITDQTGVQQTANQSD